MNTYPKTSTCVFNTTKHNVWCGLLSEHHRHKWASSAWRIDEWTESYPHNIFQCWSGCVQGHYMLQNLSLNGFSSHIFGVGVQGSCVGKFVALIFTFFYTIGGGPSLTSVPWSTVLIPFPSKRRKVFVIAWNMLSSLLAHHPNTPTHPSFPKI
jgi:hypothetical protein